MSQQRMTVFALVRWISTISRSEVRACEALQGQRPDGRPLRGVQLGADLVLDRDFAFWHRAPRGVWNPLRYEEVTRLVSQLSLAARWRWVKERHAARKERRAMRRSRSP